jgi:hypothetical protein
VVSVTSL